MHGIWTEETKDIAVKVADGNPGALRVIGELLWFTKWFKMMSWCKDNLKGPDLWEKYKDVYHGDSHKLGLWIQEQMKSR